MKKLILFFVLTVTAFGCSDDDTKENNVLIGKWELKQITYFDTTVYTPEESQDIYYTFNSDKTLIIESNVNLSQDDYSYQYTSPKTIPYSFYNDNDFLMQEVVMLGTTENSLGQYGFKIEGNVLNLYEYEGKTIRFEKVE